MNKARWGVIAGVLLILLVLTMPEPAFQGAAVYTETIHEELNTSASIIPLQFSGTPTSLRIDADITPDSVVKLVDSDSELIVSSSSLVACEETCLLSTISKNASLVIEGSAVIYSIDYSVDVENSAPTYVSNRTTFKFAQDGSLELNLEAFFADPDNDPLTYLSTGNDFLTSIVDGSTLTLSPDTGYTGISTISILALDERHSTSQEISITVEPGLTALDEVVENSPAEIEEDVIAEMEILEEVEVIVVLKEPEPETAAQVKDEAIELQEQKQAVRNATEELLEDFVHTDFTTTGSDGQVQQVYENIDAVALKVTQQGLEKISQNPNVEAVYVNSPFSTAVQDSVPLINATLAHSYNISGTHINGTGYGICIIDTGVDQDHPDLANIIISGYDYINGDADPEDDNGHGTHVTGIAHNTAPGASLIISKVCDNNGDCTAASILGGIDYCINNTVTYNISVISGSLGDKTEYTNATCPTLFDSSLQTASNLGIANVFASGNEGFTNGISYPACSPYAISVGSTTKADAISSFTNRHDLLDVLAPGSSINSTWLSAGTNTQSGTSQATPHVSAALVLINHYQDLTNGNYSAAGALQALKDTGITIDSWPRIDIYAALDNISEGNFSGSSGGNESGNFSTSASCGSTIVSDTTQTSDITCAGDGITFGAHDITLDCDKFAIRATGGGDIGIFINNFHNVTIVNCPIERFGRGILIHNSTNVTVLDSNITNSTAEGIEMFRTINFTVKNTVFRNNSFEGIEIFDNSTYASVINNTFIDNGRHDVLIRFGSNRTRVINNTMLNSGSRAISADGLSHELHIEGNFINETFNFGIIIQDSINSTIINNVVENTSNRAILLENSNFSLVSGNNVTRGNISSISLEDGSSFNIIRDNLLLENQLNGIIVGTASKNNTFSDNVISNSSFGLLIRQGSTGNRLENNSINDSNRAVQIRDESNNTFLFGNVMVRSGIRDIGIVNNTGSILVNNSITNITLDNVTSVSFINQTFLQYDIEQAEFATANEFGILKFLTRISSVSGNLSDDIMIQDQFIRVNSSVLDNPANISFFNVPFSNPAILRNGTTCPVDVCQQLSFASSVFTFNVTGFTNFSLGEGAVAVLNTSTGNNLTTENLTLNVNITQTSPHNATLWFVNNSRILDLYAPFEGGSNSTFTRDYAYEQTADIGGATFLPSGGRVGSAYQFNRTQYINFSDAVQYNITGAVAYEAWVLPRSRAPGNNISMIISKFAQAREAKSLGLNASGFADFSLFFSNNNHVNVSSTGPVPLNEWTHLIGVWDGSTARIFINGILNNSVGTSAPSVNNSNGSLFIGKNVDWFNFPTESTEVIEGLNGTIDQVRIWRYNVTGDQVAAIFDAENFSNNFVNIHSSMTQIGQNWSANVTPNDGVDDGPTLVSNNITILPSAPDITLAILNTSLEGNLSSENLTLHLTIDNPGGGAVKNITNWFLHNESIILFNHLFEHNASSNSAIDYSPYGHNTTSISAEVTYLPTGGHDGFGAYDFEGSTPNIQFGDVTFMDGLDEISFGIWFNPESITLPAGSDIESLIAKGTAGVVGTNTIFLSFQDNAPFDLHGLQCHITTSSPGSLFASVNLTNITLGNWHHTFCTWKSGETLKMYMNGTLVAESNETLSGVLNNVANPLILGGSSSSAEDYYDGQIDDVQIYNRSLSTAQVKALYDQRFDLITSEETNQGETWYAEVTPYDGTTNGSTVRSNNVTILSTTLLLNSTFATNKTTENLTAHTFLFDDRPIYNWHIHGSNDIIELAILPFDVEVSTPEAFAIRNYALDGRGNGTLGNGTTGTEPTYVRHSGIKGGGYQFDGIDDVINMTNDPIYGVDNSFSIEMWVNVSVGSRNRTKTIVERARGGALPLNYRCSVGGSITDFGIDNELRPHCDMCESLTDCVKITSEVDLVEGQMSQIVYTFDTINDLVSIYVNGTLTNQSSTTLNPNSSAHGSDLQRLYVGGSDSLPADGFNNFFPFNGTIDEIIIYNRTLSAAQIRQNFDSGLIMRNITVNTETEVGDNWSVNITSVSQTGASLLLSSDIITILADTIITFNSTVALNTSGEDLFVFIDGEPRDQNATTWIVNNQSILLVNIPFDGVSNGTFTPDFSTFDNNGSVENVTFTSNGHIGGAYVFNGSHGGRILTGATSDVDLVRNLTFEAWINLTGTTASSRQAIYDKGTDHALTINKTAAGNILMFEVSGTSPTFFGNFSSPINTDEYTHVIGTFDGTYFSLFVNGQEIHKETFTGTPTTGGGELGIGGPVPHTSDFVFNGTIDNFRVWNRTLSSQQIQAIFDAENNSGNVRTIVSEETNIGENWTAIVNPTTNNQLLPPLESNTITIINTQLGSLVLASESETNFTSEQLSYTAFGGSNAQNISTWIVNDTSIMILNAPFEGGSNGTQTRDYAFGAEHYVEGPVFQLNGGKMGGGYDFNGSDFINFSNAPQFNNFSDGVSFEVWIMPTRPPVDGNNTFIINKWVNGAESKSLRLKVSGRIDFSLFNGGADRVHNTTSTSAIPLNTWTHVVGTYDGATTRIFVNGVLENATLGDGSDVLDSTGSLFIGFNREREDFNVNAAAFHDGFNGSIDQVRIWRYNLTGDQIASIFNAENNSGNYRVIDSTMTDVGQNWTVNVTPNDGLADTDGATFQSNTVTIIEGTSISDATLQTFNNENLTTQQLNISITGGANRQNITNWIVNDSKIMRLNMPMEGGPSASSAARDYAFENTGTVVGAVFNLTGGKVGGAYEFTATGTDTIGMFHASQYNNWDSGSSISVWVKPKTYPASGTTGMIVSKFVNGLEHKFLTLGVNGRTEYSLFLGAGTNRNVTSVQTVPLDEWTHIVSSYDGATMRIFINGILDNETASSELTTLDNVGNVYVGTNLQWFGLNPTVRGMNGTIDQLMIWRYNVTGEQALAMFNAENNSGNAVIIDPSMTSVGQNWTANVTPNTGLLSTDGSTVTTNTITILPFIPGEELELNTSTGQNLSNENLTAHTFDIAGLDATGANLIYNWHESSTDDIIELAILPFDVEVTSEISGSIRNYALDGRGNGTLDNSSHTPDAYIAPTYVRHSGIRGGGYQFNGNNTVINMGNDKIYALTDSFTIEMWINVSVGSNSNSKRILNRGPGGLGVAANYACDIGSQSTVYTLRPICFMCDGISCAAVAGDGTNLTEGELSHVVWTFDNDNDLMSIYVNGSLVGTESTTLVPADSNGFDGDISRLEIGAGDGGGGIFGPGVQAANVEFNGTVDEIVIYNRSISASQVQALFNFGMRGRNITVADETSPGENWTVNVTPVNRTSVGPTNQSAEITIRQGDFIPPAVHNLSPVGIDQGIFTSVSLAANVTDNILVSDVFVNITLPDTSVDTLRMSGSNDIYTVTFANTEQQGTYTYTVYAVDNDGNVNNTVSEIFNITAGNLSCIVEAGLTCSGGATNIFHLSNLTNAHAELVNLSNLGYSVCCRDIALKNNISNSSGINILDLSNETNAHVELPEEPDYPHEVFIGSDRDNLICDAYPLSFGSCLNENQTCVVTISENESQSQTNLHAASCDVGNYSTSICCGFIGNLYIPPVDNITLDAFVANASFIGPLTNETRSLSAQPIEYQNETLGRRVEVIGLFNETDVNASLLVIEADENRTWTNATVLGGAVQEHVLFIPNSNNGTGVFVCPDAQNLTVVDRGCPNEVIFTASDFGVFKSGINVTLTNGEYKLSNVTDTGFGPIGQEARLIIFDDTDAERGSQTKLINDNVYFIANYSNSTSGTPVSAVCNITQVNSSAAPQNSMIFNATSGFHEFNMSFLEGGTFDWNVTCHNLTAGYPVQLAVDTVIILSDILPPEVQNLTPQGTFSQTDTITLRANVTDDNFVADVLVNVTRPDGTTNVLVMTNTSDIYQVDFTNISGLPGIYTYQILANDTANNRNDSVFSSFTIGAICGNSVNGNITISQNLNTNGTCFVMTQNSTLDCGGFSITGDHSAAGIAVINTDHVTVQNCFISNFNDAIQTKNSTNNTYFNNTIFNNSVRAILLFNQSSDNLVEFNSMYDQFTENSTGVLITEDSSNNIIRFNFIENSTGNGIFIATGSNNTLVHNNTVRSIVLSGIRVTVNKDTRVFNNTVSDAQDGIVALGSAHNSTIIGNHVSNTTFRGVLSFSDNENVSIIINVIEDAQLQGILVTQASNNTLVQSNRVENSSTGISITLSDNVDVLQNTVIGGDSLAIRIGLSDNVLLANNSLSNQNNSILVTDTLNVTFADSAFNPFAVIRNTSIVTVNYTSSIVVGNATNLEDVFTLSNGSVFVDSTNHPEFNKSANLVFADITHPEPKARIDVQDNGVFIDCPETICGNTSVTGSNVEYNVTHFTTYNSTEGVEPTINVTSPSGADINTDTIVSIIANITDNVAVDIALMNVTTPDGSVQLQLFNGSDPNIYTDSFPNTSKEGLYNFSFIVNDSANNIRVTDVTFSINKPTGSTGPTGTTQPPPPPPPPAPPPPITITPPPISVTPPAPTLQTQMPTGLLNTELDMDIVCAYFLEGAGQLVSALGNLALFTIPEGYEKVTEPFTLTCAGQTLDLTLSVPHTYKDLVALRCNAYGCTQIGAFALGDDELVCGGESVDDLRKAELLAQKDFLTPADFTPVRPYKKDITAASPVIAVGKHRVEFIVEESFEAGLSSPVSSVPQPKNPNTNIIGAPLIVTGQGQAIVQIPYSVPQGYDENTFAMFALEGADWMYLDSAVSVDANIVSATVNLDDYSEHGQTTLAVIGAGCDACKNVEFTKVYDGGSGRAIILMHGFMSNPITWQFLLDDFNLNDQPHQIWTVGYPSTMTMEEIVAELLDLVEAHSGEYSEIQIVGHSLGAFIAQEFLNEAAKQPDHYTFMNSMESVILVGSPNDGSDAAAEYGKLWSGLINAKSTETIFNPSSPLTQDLKSGKQVPRVDGIDYYVVAGTAPYELEVGGVVVKSEDLLDLEGENDGIITTSSAQHVGGEYLNKLCENYFEIDVPHTELINHPAGRRVIERLLTRNMYDLGLKAVGYTQYLRLNIEQCSAEDHFMIIGVPIDEAEASGMLQCSCGNGVCGVDESILTCPSDCGLIDKSFWEKQARLIILGLLALLLAIILGVLVRRIINSDRKIMPKSAREPIFKMPSFRKPKFKIPKISMPEFKAPDFSKIRIAKSEEKLLKDKYKLQRVKMQEERAKLADKFQKQDTKRTFKPLSRDVSISLPPSGVSHHETPRVLKEGLLQRFLKKFKKEKVDVDLMQKRLDRINKELKK